MTVHVITTVKVINPPYVEIFILKKTSIIFKKSDYTFGMFEISSIAMKIIKC